MNIFIAGVHGVGKTYLAKKIPESLKLMHASASKLISESGNSSTWGVDKHVSDAEKNQIILAASVKRYNDSGVRLLLDGHFVLLDAFGNFLRLGSEVFKSLNLERVVVIEAPPAVVAERIWRRDGRVVVPDEIAEFSAIERKQAKIVCEEIGIPFVILESPSIDDFLAAIRV